MPGTFDLWTVLFSFTIASLAGFVAFGDDAVGGGFGLDGADVDDGDGEVAGLEAELVVEQVQSTGGRPVTTYFAAPS